ncbi:c-type cytochrome biogenesis protein CcmI [Ectothiorhodospira lacustris]|uniref:c-type cytochrome biogenesis protein CcmI n=1 Tax=Ectothiorhodospira lacustris TaxID=2899127 RepID=UPI001EE8873E|nr:c-type cytochrome biogenesis protein CcmI [Ectothiorhodospira lacustris]MCG5499862.1 c-type cytochrome biogenesis protein CcmI [Ectothiorhodospira lacustris]MCG5509010.1 c-type cytochrome biogenesis protein CcmI [Ectothiorhodospira lacustris]MCG5520801.1 c-type cytochrome biogenesis protein CcmI [Ectothiorhodospira lacustris]
MSTGFWIGAVLLFSLAALVILWPFIRRRQQADVAFRGLNLTIYRQRMAELDQELSNGLLTREQYEAAKAELEDNLITDVEQPEETPAVPTPAPRQGMILLGITAVLVPVAALLIYFQLDTAPRMSPAQTLAMGQEPSHDMMDIERMIVQLRERLEVDPDNTENWLFLARTYGFVERFEDAAAAFDEAYRRTGDEPDLNVDYAESLMLATDGRVSRQASRLLDRALELDPDHQNGLWLGAIADFQQENYPRSAQRLDHLLSRLPEGSDAARSVAEALRDVRTMTGGMAGEQTPTADAGTDAGALAIEVEVVLDESLAGRVTGEEFIMVFARPAQGPRMPLAIVRARAESFPLNLRLEDEGGMVEGMSMREFGEVQVVARLSRTGMAQAESGDMEGVSEAVTVSADTPAPKVRLTIDRVLP